MIIMEVVGGLGNQMFQYALGRRLSGDRGVPLKLDLSAFEDYPLRTYRLHHLTIQGEIATPDDIAPFRGRRWDQRALRFVSRLLPYYRRPVVQEQHPGFDPRILDVPSNRYLSGYWQNEQYFAPIEAVIRCELTIRTAPSPANQEMLARISRTNAVSLHIRRSDYAANPITNQHHGVLPLAYYTQAIEALVQTVPDPHFFIFSDEPAWARDNLNIPYPVTVVDINGPDQDYEDLRLMSACKYHIVANSSFSWWGAWLCTIPHKEVYAPAQWLRDSILNSQFTLPEQWHRVSVDSQ